MTTDEAIETRLQGLAAYNPDTGPKPSIAIVANTSWYLNNFRAGLVRRLCAEGYAVTCHAPHDDYARRLPECGCRFFDLYMDRSGVNPLRELRTIHGLWNAYRRVRPDLVLHYTPKVNIYGSLAAGSLRIPFVNNISGLGTGFTGSKVVTKIVETLYAATQKRASRVFFQNPDDQRYFVSSGLVSPDQADLLPGSGVDLMHFCPREARPADGKLVFLLVGRLLWEKGLREFAEAAERMRAQRRDVEFQLLGMTEDGNPRYVSDAELRRWQQDGIAVWHGSSEDVRPYIAGADCVVLPSSYREGTPRSLLEAASMGKPVIATDAVGSRQVLDDGVTGFLCQPKSVDSLVKVMRAVVELSEAERLEMGRRGRRKMIAEFDEEIVLGKYLKTVEEVFRERPRPLAKRVTGELGER